MAKVKSSPIIRSAAARMVVSVTSALCGFGISHIVITEYGVAGFAAYGLLVSLVALVPFADLGLSSYVMNTVTADDPQRLGDRSWEAISTAERIGFLSALVLASIAALLAATNTWPQMLALPNSPNMNEAALLCTILFALTLPIVSAQTILTATGRNALLTMVQGVVAPVTLGCLLLTASLNLPIGSFAGAFQYASMAFAALVCVAIVRRIHGSRYGVTFKDAPFASRTSTKIALRAASPMLVQMTALPIAMQSDRLIIAHLSSTIELARYNLAAQLFGFALQIVATAGVALWPIYARARHTHQDVSPARMSVIFAAAGMAAGLLIAVVAPVASSIISSDTIHLNPLLLVSFALFVTVQAAKNPLGMYLTDPRDLRFQMWPVLVLLPVNVGLSLILVSPLGAAGPVAASAVSVLVCQLVPYALRARRTHKQRASLDSQAA